MPADTRKAQRLLVSPYKPYPPIQQIGNRCINGRARQSPARASPRPRTAIPGQPRVSSSANVPQTPPRDRHITGRAHQSPAAHPPLPAIPRQLFTPPRASSSVNPLHIPPRASPSLANPPRTPKKAKVPTTPGTPGSSSSPQAVRTPSRRERDLEMVPILEFYNAHPTMSKRDVVRHYEAKGIPIHESTLGWNIKHRQGLGAQMRMTRY